MMTSTLTMPYDRKPCVALIDGDVLAYRIGHVTETASEDYAKYALSSYLEELWGLHVTATGYKGYLSTPGEHYRHRIALTAPYKGNRKDKVKPRHFKALRALMAGHFKFQMSEDCEADDMLGHESQRLGPGNCVVVSVDKDLLMLPGDHYNMNSHKVIKVTEQSGLVHFYRQVLTGDRVDNIKGRWLPDMPRNLQIGEVRAKGHITEGLTELEMFNRAVELFGSRTRVMENCNLLWIQRTPRGYFKAPDGDTTGEIHNDVL